MAFLSLSSRPQSPPPHDERVKAGLLGEDLSREVLPWEATFRKCFEPEAPELRQDVLHDDDAMRTQVREERRNRVRVGFRRAEPIIDDDVERLTGVLSEI